MSFRLTLTIDPWIGKTAVEFQVVAKMKIVSHFFRAGMPITNQQSIPNMGIPAADDSRRRTNLSSNYYQFPVVKAVESCTFE